MAAQLTPDAVAAISEHADGNGTLKPVLQVMDVRLVTNKANASERFRMVLSDGVHTLQSMLATAENQKIRDGSITKGTIIHLQEFTCSTIQHRRIIIIINLDILQSECAIIGSPVPYGSMNQPREQAPNVPAAAAQTYDGTYSGGPGLPGSSVAPRASQVANNQGPYVPATAAQTYGGTYSGGPGLLGSSVAPRAPQVANNQGPTVPAAAAQTYGGTYSGGPGLLGSSVAPRAPQVANNQGPNVPATAAQTYSGTYSGGPGLPGSSVSPRALQVANNQGPNVLASAAQTYGETYSGGPGLRGSFVASRAPQAANNLSYGESYSGGQGMVGSSIGRTIEPVPNASSGGSYSMLSAHNTMNTNMVQPPPQQPSLNSQQNQRFTAPATTGGICPPSNAYGRPAQPLYQQAPVYMNRGPATKNDATIPVVPIAQLNPFQSRWAVQVRVTAKTDIRPYTNARGSGKVFNFDLLDAQGGEIRATCFNAQADQFYNQIEIGKVYLITRGHVRPVKDKRYNHLNHDCEVTLDYSTSIQSSVDDGSIPMQQYNFREIGELENMEVKAIVDLVGVVTSVSPSVPILRKDGTEVQKQNLQLRDMSGRSVEVTFWGKFCDAEGQQLQQLCDSGLNPILALKNCQVTEFNGRSLSTISSTQLKINPEFPEAVKLRHWYENEGKTTAFVSLSREKSSTGMNGVRKTVAQIKDEELGRHGKPEWITVKGAISHLKADNFFYPACTLEANGRQCNKKVTNNGDGSWYCDKCDKPTACEYRYLLMCQIQDHTGVTYATAFQEGGMEIIGRSAGELAALKEEDEAQFAEVMQGVRFQMYIFKIKVVEETFNDESRIKCNIVKAEKLDSSKESGYILQEIDSILQGDGDAGAPPEVQGAMAYTAGFNNSGHSVPTSDNADAAHMGHGAMCGDSGNQFGQQTNTYGRAPTPVSATWNVPNCMTCGSSGHTAQNCPAGMCRPQPAASAASSYASSPGNAGSDLCYNCHQPGHHGNVCPEATSVPQPQSYGNASGGYSRQPYVGATTNY
ncbi:hypothetical protein EJB05_34390 [Eragrostis curvula]|uniref:Replication protein A subunit n=1 Tax=Eragrostis curvula TaxID=38414 RepID=A0A5J9U570_9POAL|nr:hypothetical protein EJB05_34390 [Eragrostis curvula]